MLNIPSSVKALFQADGVHKNFRAHFPNGEMADITNDNVVQESVKFTESLCSQSTFKFGCSEASVLEFETVGVGNMYGMTIEAGIEIDTSSLSAADISTIQAGSWDGTLVLAADSDIGYGFFRVPLGVFRVESCPRNHGAMAHRQVTAYTEYGGSGIAMSPFETWKQASTWDWTIGDQLNYGNVDALIDSNIGYFAPSVITGKYTKTALPTALNQYVGTFVLIDLPGGRLRVKYDIPSSKLFRAYHNTVTPPFIYSVELGDFSNDSAISFIAESLVDWSVSDAYGDVIKILQHGISVTAAQSNAVRVILNTGNIIGYFPIETDVPIMYFPDNEGHGATFYAPLQSTITLEWTPTGGIAETKSQSFTFSSGAPFTAYSLVPTSADAIPVSFKSTGEVAVGTFKYHSFANSYNIADLLTGSAEICGRFWRVGRGGTPELIVLDPATALTVVPGDYDECWWDEYDVSPIGTVDVTYKSGEAETTAVVTIGAGASQYEMLTNSILRIMSSVDYGDIVSLLLGDFASNAQNVAFTPIELTMQGWPWMEAGDALEITAEDGTLVETYALRIEITGIQNLMANITAQGGQIIEEVE